MEPQVKAAIITGAFALIAAIVSAIVTFLLTSRDGAWLIRRPTTIKLSGSSKIMSRLTGDRLVSAADANYEERIRNGILKIAGRKAKFAADFQLSGATRSVTGKLKAHGRLHNNKAFMTYEVNDPVGGQYWYGVMALNITAMGAMEAYFLTESSKLAGAMVIGHMTLDRR